ncbi:MAG: hypothetical protein LBB43_05960, partial [Spirochaetaceae bacterium]|nr:hypothetical protein [Spirochaetaceae bacterium]
MTQRLLIPCFVALLIAQRAPLYATLGSFQNTIEASEAGGAAQANSQNPSTVDYGVLTELITQLLILLWFPDNFFFNYGRYPYEEEGFIQRP